MVIGFHRDYLRFGILTRLHRRTAMTTDYHVTAETETHIIEADCEVDYRYDSEAEPEDMYYPVGRYRWDNVVVTDKKTGLSEDWGDEMPDNLTNLVRESAQEQFPL